MSIVNKGVIFKRYMRVIAMLLMTVCLSFLFQMNEANASTQQGVVGATSSHQNGVKTQTKDATISQNKVVTVKPQTNHTLANQATSMPQNKTQLSKQPCTNSNRVKPNEIKNQHTVKAVGTHFSKQKPTQHYQVSLNKRVATTQVNKQKSSKVARNVAPTKVTSHKITKKPQHVATKPQLLSQTATKAPTTTKTSKKATITKSKPATPSVKTAVKTTKPTTQTTTKKNYYNQAPKRWPSNVPGGDNVRDFGQTTKESGIDDALKIMKKSGNKGVTIEHAKAKDANIATVYNWNPTAKQLTYGTGTAIGKHTILTANHVVNDQRAHKPLTPSQPQNMRINILQEGSKVVRTLEVFGVQMLQYGDVSLVYTYEDISKYMKVRKIASESSIQSMKANTPIHMYHYGKPTGKYKNDPAGTMYHSKGKYTMTARNVNPIGYYQMMAEPGSSGGAVLNSKNEVIGVHAFRLNSGDYKKYNLNTMAEIRGKLRKEIIDNIV